MKQKMLSLFLALSMLMPLIGAFPIVSSAENKDDDTYGNPMSDWTENTDEEIYDDLVDILESDEVENTSQNQGEEYETTVAYSDSAILQLEQYDVQLDAIAGQIGSTDPSVLTENEEYVNVLLKRRLVDKIGYDRLAAKMNENADFAACMEWLFTDIQMLRYYSYGGEPEANGYYQKNRQVTPDTYIKSFDVLTRLYTKHKEDMNDTENAPLYKRMMAAIALTHCVPIYTWFNFTPTGKRQWFHESEPVERYEIYKRFYNRNLLADEFTKYNVEELRMVVGCPLDNDQLQWIHRYYRVNIMKNPDYMDNPVKATTSNANRVPVKYTVNDREPNKPASAQYYDPANYDKWNNKYTLEYHDEIFDYKVDYGVNEKKKYFEPQWLPYEAGGVCVDISLTGTVTRNAFGLAARYLCQPTVHMSYLTYYYNNGKPTCASSYNMSGIQRSNYTTYGYTHVPAGWSNFGYHGIMNGGYIFLGIDAMYNNHNTNYEKAENLAYLAEIQTAKENYEQALEIYEKVLEAQYFHLDAYVNIARLYEKLGKTDDDYYALAERAAEALKWYPHPMYEYIINFLYPKINDIIKRADLIGFVRSMLDISASATAENSGMFQPSQCIEGAGYCRTLLAKIAEFSFETQSITLTKNFVNTGKDLLYSFDRGETWNRWTYEEGVISHKLTPEEVAQITDANDIYCKFDTAKYSHIIPISTNAMPPTNKTTNIPNDDEDKFINLQKGLEYSTDGGQTWKDLTSEDVFEGNVTVWVRKKATGAFLAGPHFVAEFTAADDTPERRYLRISGNVKLSDSPESMKANPPKNAIDTRKDTFWEKKYTVAVMVDESGNVVPTYGDEFIFEISDPHYVSAIGYIPKLRTPAEDDGTITGCEVYISNDKKTWKLAGSTNNWAYVKSPSDEFPREQYIDFDEPAYTKYVKIKVTKAGVKFFSNYNRGYATAAEFKLYENQVCPEKTVKELNLEIAPEKTNYKVGDRLDLDSITARLLYDDGTTSIIPAGALELSEDVFDSTDIKEVLASYNGIETSFAVSVSANDREATAISAVTISDRKYYAQDAFDKSNILVQVTDGTNKWYLLPNEFEFENPVLAEGRNTLKVIHNGLSSNFTVNAEKAVKEIRIDTDENFKTQYYIGDAMDLSGMSTHLVYSDGTEKVLNESEYNMELSKDGNVPITGDIFARTAGTKTIKASLKDKEEINTALDITVFSYIMDGEFTFEALAGETECMLTGFTPSEDISGRNVEIPDTVTVGGYEYKVVNITNGAFANTPELEAVTIPESVKTIDAGAFSACTALEKVYMTDHKTLDGFVCDKGAFAAVQDGYVYLHHTLANSESPIEGYKVAGISQAAESIIVTPPDKTEYILGEDFDKKGMVVTVVLPDGSKVNTNAYSMRGYYPTITGEQTITITLDGSKIKQTFKVNVNFPEVTIEKSPVGDTYAVGDEINPIKVIASSENNNALSYQWYRSETEEKNGTAITGATKAEYIPEQDGYYYAAVYVKDKNNKVSESIYSDSAHIMIGDYEAINGTNGYDSLKKAIDNAPENSTIRVCKDIEVNDTIAVSGKKFTIDGQGHTLSRGSEYKKSFILMTDQSAITLKNIIFDGGAVWTGEEDPVVKRGLTNSGLTATAPFILSYAGTELILSDGAIMQNNYNTGTVGNNAEQILDDNLTGGAIWGIDSTITMNGGVIRNNASTVFGSAMYIRGNNSSVITIYDGEITGNNGLEKSRTSAICADNNTSVNVQNGIFSNNKGGTEGGVFWMGKKTLIISGGTFENNYSAGNGGVVFFNQGGDAVNLTLTNGVFRNNRAAQDGGALFCGNLAKVSGCTFENNTAGRNGGAVWINKEGISLTSNTFTDNTAVNGGAVWSGNAVTTSSDKFIGNSAEKGDAIYINGSRQLTIGNVDTIQDIYLQTLVPVKLTGMNYDNKHLSIITGSEITNDMKIAYAQYAPPVDIRVNGYKAEYIRDEDGNLVGETKGYPMKAVVALRVVYNKDGGKIDNEWQYTIYNTGTPLTLPEPHKDGYNFAGWFDNAELTGTAVTEIGASETEDKTFWAKWTVAEYSVNLNVNGGTVSDTLNKYTYGEGAVLPVPEKNGYNFAGWFDNAECEGAMVTEITAKDFGNKEYWAKWAENGYSVTLNTNGGMLAENLTEYTYGEGAVLPVPSRDNYTFEGWFDNAECEGTAVTEISAQDTGNKVYWAKWKINEYVIRFVNYNNRLLQQTNVEFGKHPEYTGAVPEKDAEDKYTYTFAGWSPEITSVTGDTTYTAQFNAVPRVYSLMLNLDEGILDNEEAYMEYTCGTGVALPTPRKDDFYFVGWYDNEDYSGEPINAVTAENFGDKAFWAKWTQEAPAAFKITFVNYDNTELWSGDVEVGVIPQYNGSEPKRESDDKYSYRFIGWDKELSEVTEITTYVAQFERTPIDYFVEYTNNGNALVGAPEAGEYDVIFAAYDLYNGLVGVKKVHTVFDDTGEKTVESENFSIDGAVKVKVMLWDSLDSMIPICKAAEKIITE